MNEGIIREGLQDVASAIREYTAALTKPPPIVRDFKLNPPEPNPEVPKNLSDTCAGLLESLIAAATVAAKYSGGSFHEAAVLRVVQHMLRERIRKDYLPE